MADKPETLCWIGDKGGHLMLIDQTKLPVELREIECRRIEDVWEAIKSLRIRGAPAIGIAAAYGICVGLQDKPLTARKEFLDRVHDAAAYLATSRPTAVNLFWAIDRMERAARKLATEALPERWSADLLEEARAIHDEDRVMCHAIGSFGAELLHHEQGVLTHCNAGGLATSEYGTALSVFFTAQDQGKLLHIFVDETRPLLQGSRLTAWELTQRGIKTTLICDSMAAQVMREQRVQAVVTGADRIAANGDTANKIGTYGLAVLAQAHDIPFYVAAPTNTFDMTITNGKEIPIEVRAAEEVTHGFNCQTAPDEVNVYNPAFDVTPASLIHSIITEKGIVNPVSIDAIRSLLTS